MSGLKSSDNIGGIKKLRHLLLGGESQRITNIERKLRTWPRPEDVARALPDAIKQCDEQGDALNEAIAPTVMKALKVGVQREPEPLVEALFPLLGPMIRRYIQSSLSGMVQSLNQATEHSFNLKLRYHAWRAGMTVGQYALLNKLVYRVDQVYLIHNETGLALLALENDGVESPDPDMVSGMLTAITDFVRDSFQADNSDTLEQITMGPHQILVSPGPKLSIACAVRGVAPQELAENMDELVESLHFRHSIDLDAFEGDSEPFQASEPALAGLLKMETLPDTGSSTSTRLVYGLVASMLCLGLGFTGLQYYRFQNFVRELELTPGILVTQSSFSPLGYHTVRGLKDPASVNPSEIATETGMNADKIRQLFGTYKSLEPELLESRIIAVFDPPESAELGFRNGVLTVSGRASKEWMRRASLLAAALPGVDRYEAGELEDIDPLGRIEALLSPPKTISLVLEDKHLVLNGAATHSWLVKARKLAATTEDIGTYEDGSVTDLDKTQFDKIRASLESHSIYFGSGTSEFRGAAQDTIAKAAADWKRLVRQAGILGLTIGLQVTGQADATGTVEQNAKLSKERAGRVKNQLVSLGVEENLMSVEAIQAQGEDPRLRRVIFLVLIR